MKIHLAFKLFPTDMKRQVCEKHGRYKETTRKKAGTRRQPAARDDFIHVDINGLHFFSSQEKYFIHLLPFAVLWNFSEGQLLRRVQK